MKNAKDKKKILAKKQPYRLMTQKMAAEFVAGLNRQVAEKHQPPACLKCGDI